MDFAKKKDGEISHSPSHGFLRRHLSGYDVGPVGVIILAADALIAADLVVIRFAFRQAGRILIGQFAGGKHLLVAAAALGGLPDLILQSVHILACLPADLDITFAAALSEFG